jgi:hypothetical protein
MTEKKYHIGGLTDADFQKYEEMRRANELTKKQNPRGRRLQLLVDTPTDLWLRVTAAKIGCSVNELINRSIAAEIQRSEDAAKAKRKTKKAQLSPAEDAQDSAAEDAS